MNQWRVIVDSAHAGPTNMAIDQAIMESVANGQVPPTLRFYAWQPACLSLGYGQSLEDIDLQRLREHGWDVVRRPTGGKAILHTDELTYSVSLPATHPIVHGGIVESYRRLSTALLEGLHDLHVTVDITARDNAGQATGPVCFEVPSHYEVTALGKKLIGSAQVRRRGVVLQHGTLPLYGDVTRIVNALVYETETDRGLARQKVAARAATLEEIAGRWIDWQTVADALAAGFAKTFDLELVEAALTAHEANRAAELRASVYADPARSQPGNRSSSG